MMTAKIRHYRSSDCPALLAIYNLEIEHHSATFEETTLTEAAFAERLTAIQIEFPVLVIEYQNKLVGYAYANHYKSRSAYRFCAETTIYLSEEVHGKGLGTQLYLSLLRQLKQQGIQQVLAVVTHPNQASSAFHQRLGFKQVGLLQQVGYKFERWYDIALYQRNIVEPF